MCTKYKQNMFCKTFIKDDLQSLQHYKPIRSTDWVVKEKLIKDKHHENFHVTAHMFHPLVVNTKTCGTAG